MKENPFDKLKAGDREKKALGEFLDALIKNEALKLSSFIIYASAAGDDYQPGASDINALVAAANISVETLKPIIADIQAARLAAISPFFITPDNLRSSADVFPVKFMAMRDSYILIYGEDLLAGLKIGREHLRLRCEQEAKNLYLRLCRYYIVNSGRSLDSAVSRMSGGFFETLRAALSLDGENLVAREKVFDLAQERFNIPRADLEKIKASKRARVLLPGPESEKLFSVFMSSVEKLSQCLDRL